MNKTIRLGAIGSNFEHIIENVGQENECTFDGYIGDLLSVFVNGLENLNYNCTRTLFSDTGVLNETSGEYSDLLGAIQQDKIDLSIWMFPYPLKNLDSIVDYGLPFIQEQLSLVCWYNYTQDKNDISILKLFMVSLDYQYYLSIILVFISLSMIWSTTCKIMGRRLNNISSELSKVRKYSWWLNLRALLDQDHFPTLPLGGLSILSFIISLYFWLMYDTWMLNVMGSDLVVFKDPKVIRTLSEAHESNTRIVFIPPLPETTYFRDAPIGSLERNLWENGFKISDNLIADMKILQEGFPKQQFINVYRHSLNLAPVTFGLKRRKEIYGDTNLRALITPLDPPKQVIGSVIWRADLQPDAIQKLQKINFRLTESGLIIHQIQNRIPKIFGGSEILAEQLISTKLFVVPMPKPFVSIQHTLSLFSLIIILFIFAIFQLSFEIFVNS